MPRTDTNINAKVLAHSINKFGNEIITFEVTYPRIIIAEVNTHRMLSRSTASSRAIPVRKMIEKVKNNPFVPSWIGASQPGMQAAEELVGESEERFLQEWKIGASIMSMLADTFERIGVHKQITNRILEPWLYVKSIITATDIDNLYKLRCHKDAQPEFMVLAFKMLAAHCQSVPLRSDLHIPFGDQMEHGLTEGERILVACARCARISYENHDGKRDVADDLRLAESLIKAGHMSPFEHVAKAHINDTYVGNFRGWVQHRKYIVNENIKSIDRLKLLATRPEWV